MFAQEYFHAENPDQVIPTLERVIRLARTQNNPVGYFASLYRLTSIEILDAVDRGIFENNVRMARMDMIFANRYFDALNAYAVQKPLTWAWRAAFEGCANNHFTVLQHLFLGMNAHIHLDLPIAAAEAANDDPLHLLQGDFEQINAILGSLFHITEHDLAACWRPLKHFLRFGEKATNLFLAFEMGKETRRAWREAGHIHKRRGEVREKYIAKLDQKVYKLALKVYRPGVVFNPLLHIMRHHELGSVGEKIQEFHNSVGELPHMQHQTMSF